MAGSIVVDGESATVEVTAGVASFRLRFPFLEITILWLNQSTNQLRLSAEPFHTGFSSLFSLYRPGGVFVFANHLRIQLDFPRRSPTTMIICFSAAPHNHFFSDVEIKSTHNSHKFYTQVVDSSIADMKKKKMQRKSQSNDDVDKYTKAVELSFGTVFHLYHTHTNTNKRHAYALV